MIAMRGVLNSVNEAIILNCKTFQDVKVKLCGTARPGLLSLRTKRQIVSELATSTS